MLGTETVSGVRQPFEKALQGLSVEVRREALTHVSYANERSTVSNQRLEFLGDAVLQLGVGHLLYNKYPGAPEGDLTRMRAHLVSGAALASLGAAVGLGDHLLLGRGEESSGGRDRPTILAGAMEAVIGGFYLEKGWDETLRLIELIVASREFQEVPVDPKTLVQEQTQWGLGSTPRYEVVSVEGPDHIPLFTVACLVGGKQVSLGKGRSKKEAQEDAAARFLALKQSTHN